MDKDNYYIFLCKIGNEIIFPMIMMHRIFRNKSMESEINYNKVYF